MSLFVEVPIRFWLGRTAGIGFDLSSCAQVVSDEVAQVVGIICGIANDVAHTTQPCNQATRLRRVAPLAGCDRRANRQAKRIDRGVNLCG